MAHRTLSELPSTRPRTSSGAKKAVKKAFQYQMDGVGFTMIEVLSQCPTNWKMNTVEACRWVDEVMSKTFPIGVIKDAGKGRKDAD